MTARANSTAVDDALKTWIRENLEFVQIRTYPEDGHIVKLGLQLKGDEKPFCYEIVSLGRNQL